MPHPVVIGELTAHIELQQGAAGGMFDSGTRVPTFLLPIRKAPGQPPSPCGNKPEVGGPRTFHPGQPSPCGNIPEVEGARTHIPLGRLAPQ